MGKPTRLFPVTNASRWATVTPEGFFLYLDDVEPEEGEQAPDTTGSVLVQNRLSRFAADRS